jgi:uncharacterized protein (TIGR02118 family)
LSTRAQYLIQLLMACLWNFEVRTYEEQKMKVRMGLLNKKGELTDDQFRKYWLHRHAPVVLKADLPGLLGYHQNHVIDAGQRGIQYSRGQMHLDGFSELWFEDEDATPVGFASSELTSDEQQFTDSLHIVTAERYTVVSPPEGSGKTIKRMSLLRRLPGLSEAQFRHEWCDVHAGLVSRMSGVRGYRQNLITARERVKGKACEYDELPIDGIVELWFDDEASLDAAFASTAGRETMAHAKTFISEITTFLVQDYQIV